MAGISAAEARELLWGDEVWYRTSWGYVGKGTIVGILGSGHVEIQESKGDSIITSVKNLSRTEEGLSRLPVYA